ncbi:MAG: glycoside hydrolase family 15 protein [Planctomycetota bacterium]
MPRDIPVGNGQMLVCFDGHYRIRDLYYPHVGQENHLGGGPCRFGVFADEPGVDYEAPAPPDHTDEPGDTHPAPAPSTPCHGRLYWTDQGWDITQRYAPDTLATDVTLRHDALQLELRCQDVTDFHRSVMVRRIEVVNRADHAREVRVVHHQDLHMFGSRVGDTAYFDPQLRSLIHYRKDRYVMCCFYKDGEQQIDEYATGTAGFGGAEGTWRDAEDGKLGNNPIAQGAVDSTMLASTALPPGGMRVMYMVIACGHSYDDCESIHQFLHREGPQGVIDRTVAYWRLWLAAARTDFSDARRTGVSTKVADLFKRSLLTVRTQIDNQGAILAANDSDYLQYSRDTYSYLWPRDGAFVADALDAAGFPDIARNFFLFCAKVITGRGMFLHKYNPDGTPASSWHPWVDDRGNPQLPIQEDETALVVWALWRHYVRYRDIEFVRPLWVRLVQPAADFLLRYRDPQSGLPLPSYDLWEERFGVHAFTTATVFAGLKAAWQFAVCFGDTRRARRYALAADRMRDAFTKHFWNDDEKRFVRRLEHHDPEAAARAIGDVLDGRTPRDPEDNPMDSVFATPQAPSATPPETGPETAANKTENDNTTPPDANRYKQDPVIDASSFAIWAMGLLPADDPRVASTMQGIEDRLTVKTDVGGVARYEDDHYHKIVQDTDRVPGNPWFICTLWLADYAIARANTVEELEPARKRLEWVAERALPSGVLAEQVHPETNAPISVSPLTWSHATVVSTLVAYYNKLDVLLRRVSGQPGRRAEDRVSEGLAPETATQRQAQIRQAIIEATPELGG